MFHRMTTDPDAEHTYTAGMRGQVLFDKGNDHLIDADRCALLAHYLDTQEVSAQNRGTYYPRLRLEAF